MKTTLKTLTAISLICSLMSSVKAEEKFTKEEIAQAEREDSYAMLGRLVASAKKHFTTTEKEKFSELIKIGLERDRIHKEHVSAKNKGGRKP
jgi:hypothetical protein